MFGAIMWIVICADKHGFDALQHKGLWDKKGQGCCNNNPYGS